MTAKRSHPHLTLAVLSIAGLAYAMLSSAVVPALPTIQHDLNATETGIAWLLTGYLLPRRSGRRSSDVSATCSARSTSSSGRSSSSARARCSPPSRTRSPS
jgi:hypothetical protein